MKNLVFAIAALLLFTAQKCQDEGLSEGIYREWMHSVEESTDKVQVYRPIGYKFPAMRGREGFKIQKENQFIEYGFGPADAFEERKGTWTYEGNQIVKVSIPEKSYHYKLKFLSLKEDVLKLERLNN